MRHNAVADEFIDDAIVAEYDVGHRLQILVQLSQQLDRIGFFGERGETPDVGKQDRQLLLFTLEIEIVQAIHDIADQLRRDVAFERAARARKFAVDRDVTIAGVAGKGKRGGEQGADMGSQRKCA